MKKIAEILNQLKLVIKGKTIDALLPAISFALASNFLDIIKASVLAIAISIGLLIRRILMRNSIKYSVGGLAIVLVATGFVLISGKAENYYLPSVISNFSIFIVSIISLIIKKPLAAISSHLTRGWTFKWYERDDVYPAYKEVTIIWSAFFLVRFLIQLRFYLTRDIVQIGILNLMLSLPFTIIVLVISYIYGIWRLNNLSGPSVEEYEKNIDPPWEG